MSETKSKMQQYAAGLRAGVPVILGFVPVGIAYAVMAQQAGFSVFETIFMSAAVFAGASQMMAVGMYVQGAGLAAMIVATFILNLRHLIMSTCVVDRMKERSMSVLLLAAFGVTDESFAIFTTGSEENSTSSYFLGLITVTYSSWIAGSAIGALASGLLPPMLSASLGIALYAMFIAILVPGLKGNLRLGILAAGTALVNLALSRVMASSWALIASTLIGAAVGTCFVDLEGEGSDDE